MYQQLQVVVYLSMLAIGSLKGQTSQSDDMRQLILSSLRQFESTDDHYSLAYEIDVSIPEEGQRFFRRQLDYLTENIETIELETSAPNVDKAVARKQLLERAGGEVQQFTNENYKCFIRRVGNTYHAGEYSLLVREGIPNEPKSEWSSQIEFFSRGTFTFVINNQDKQVRMLSGMSSPPFSSGMWEQHFLKVDGGSIEGFIVNALDTKYSFEEDTILVKGKFPAKNLPFDFVYEEDFEIIFSSVPVRPLSVRKYSNSGGRRHLLVSKRFIYDFETPSNFPSETEEMLFDIDAAANVAPVKQTVARVSTREVLASDADKPHVPSIPEGYVFSNDITNQVYVVGDNFRLIDSIIDNEKSGDN